MQQGQNNRTRELLAEVQRRLPGGQRFVQEAFTTEHRRPVLIKLAELSSDTFYLFDEITARAFGDAVVELAGRHDGGQLILTYPLFGEFRAQKNRLQQMTDKLDRISVLAPRESRKSPEPVNGLEFHSIAANRLSRFRIALKEGAQPILFICRRTQESKVSDRSRSVGFFSFDRDTVEQIADEIECVTRGTASRLQTFEKLELLHQTTQRVARELESYSRRMELAIRRVQRRPDLLTPARFDRIVGQAIVKMEQLKEIPRRALRSMSKSGR